VVAYVLGRQIDAGLTLGALQLTRAIFYQA